MKRRLTKIYTRAGDAGKTRLGDSARVDKNDLRVGIMGDVDELNSSIGVVLAQDNLPEKISEILTRIQQELFDLGAELCLPKSAILKESYVTQLEKDIDFFNEKLPELTEFILPSGTKSSAHCQMARCICRRAERNFVQIPGDFNLNPESLRYLNRLSDLLFVVARVINQAENQKEILWRGL
jgi:cob(I)alamin adenosyltransferase